MESAMPSRGAGRGVRGKGFWNIGASTTGSDDAGSALASAMTVAFNVTKGVYAPVACWMCHTRFKARCTEEVLGSAAAVCKKNVHNQNLK